MERLALKLLHVAAGCLDLFERVVALFEQHRQRQLAACVGRPGVDGLGHGVMGGVGDEVAARVLKLEAHGKRDLLAGLGVNLHNLERSLRDVVVHELRRIVLTFLADRGLPVLHGKEGLSPLRFEGVGHVGRDHLMNTVGSVGERACPAAGLAPAVDFGVVVLGGGEPVLVHRDGAHAVAGFDELAGLGREHCLCGIVIELELHSGHKDAHDLLRHVTVRLVVDGHGHFLHEAEISALDGVGNLGRVVGVDGLALSAVGSDAHAEHLRIPAVPVVEVVALGGACLLDQHRSQGNRCVAVGLVVEGISRVLVLVGQVGKSIGVRLEHPGARRGTGSLGRRCVGVIARIVANGEERAFKRRVSLRLALVGVGINLADEHAHRV